MPITWIMMIILALSPVVTYGVMAAREHVVVGDAVRRAVSDERRDFSDRAKAAQQEADRRVTAAATQARAEQADRLSEAAGKIKDLEDQISKLPIAKDGKQVMWPRALVREINR